MSLVEIGWTDRLRIRIEHYFVGIEPILVRRDVIAAHLIAVMLAGPHIGQIAVLNLIGLLQQLDAARLLLGVWRVEQAQFDFLGVLRKQSKIDSRSIALRSPVATASLAKLSCPLFLTMAMTLFGQTSSQHRRCCHEEG